MLPDDPSQWIQNSDDGRSGLLQHQVNAIRGRHRIQRKTGACPCLDRGDQPGGLQRSDVRGSDPGRVVEKGPSKSVFNPAWHPYTKLLLSSVPELRQGWLESVAETAEAKAASDGDVAIGAVGCRFANRCARVIRGTCDSVSPPIRELDGGLFIACHLDVADLPVN